MTNRKWLHVAFGVVILGLLSTASTGASGIPNRTTNFTFSGALNLASTAITTTTTTGNRGTGRGSATSGRRR